MGYVLNVDGFYLLGHGPALRQLSLLDLATGETISSEKVKEDAAKVGEAEYLKEQNSENVMLQEDGSVTIILSEEERQTRLSELKEKVVVLAKELEEATGITSPSVSEQMTDFTFYTRERRMCMNSRITQPVSSSRARFLLR